MKIQDWLPQERPREKLLKQGAESLSDSELLAILLGSGIRGLNCVDWAREQLTERGGLVAFFRMDSQELLALAGLGPAQTARIIAVREIAARFAKAKLSPRQKLEEPQALVDYLRLSLGNEKREKFRVFFLNKKLEILEEVNLFEGTIDETPVYPREIVERALLCRATCVILAHNHPSGRLQPSPEDIRVTQKIVSACDLVGVRVLDHVIVGAEGYFSFCHEGILPQA